MQPLIQTKPLVQSGDKKPVPVNPLHRLITCGLCYFRGTSEYRRDVKTPKGHVVERRCPIIKKFIRASHPICAEFELDEEFLCHKRGYTTMVETCWKNQKYNEPECVGCKQYKVINEAGRLTLAKTSRED